MHRSIPTVRGVLFAALLVGLPGAVALADAAEQSGPSCSPAAPAKKKGRFGGFLAAARQAGAGALLGSGVIGNGEAAHAAGALAGAAIDGRGAASAVRDAAGSSEYAQAAGVVAGTAAQLAQQASADCAATDASF